MRERPAGPARQAEPSAGEMRAVAVCSALLGPCGMWLYESGFVDWFGLSYSLNLWIVLGLAAFGLAGGVYALTRGVLMLSVLSLLLNAGVFALYGFLGLFFGLGGSR